MCFVCLTHDCLDRSTDAADDGGMNDARRHAPAAARNRDAILEVLNRHLPESGLVLEIASGSGEHVVHFACASSPLLPRPVADGRPDAVSRRSALSHLLGFLVDHGLARHDANRGAADIRAIALKAQACGRPAHWLFCVGCCVPLMLLLFAGPAMDLRWAAGLAITAMFEN